MFTPKDVNDPTLGGSDDPMEVYDRYDFFDPVLYQPVSLRDKMTGTHSSGEASTHKLISISDAYMNAVEQSKKTDSVLTSKRENIQQLLAELDDKLREVNLNFANVEEKIYQALKEALMQLQNETKKKVSSLLSAELELRRQLEQVEWMETYLDKQRIEVNEIDFLNMWRCHTSMRSDVCRQRVMENGIISSVKGDLELHGAITVLQEGAAAQANGVNGGVIRDLMADANAGANMVTGAAPPNMMSPTASSMLSRTLEELHVNPAIQSALPATAAAQPLAGMSYTANGMTGGGASTGAGTFADLMRQQSGPMGSPMMAASPVSPMKSMTPTRSQRVDRSPGVPSNGRPLSELLMVAKKFSQ